MPQINNLRKVVMQNIFGGKAFHVTKDFRLAIDENAESWIQEHEANGYKVVSEKNETNPSIGGSK